MRYINIDKLPDVFNELNSKTTFDDWLEEAEHHLSNIRGKNKKERSDYWTENSHWTKLYSSLSRLSGEKCWYSESPENSSRWEVEHFRPKARATINNELVLKDGYWWLSYHWKNFRLAGSFVNKRSKDPFTADDSVFGKGNYFPLDETSTVAEPEDMYCSDEKPLLLDPIKPKDCTLISFDKNGDVYPTFSEEESVLKNKKALYSIDYYGLKQTSLKRGRGKIWRKCETIVSITGNEIKKYMDDENKREEIFDNCYLGLANLYDISEPYTSVVKSFVKEKSKDENYNWLSDAIYVLQ